MIRRATVGVIVLVAAAAAIHASVGIWMPSMLSTALLANGAAVPGVVQHQGVVAVNGVRFTGAGNFKFAIVDVTTGLNLWTNDGTQIGAANPPTDAVAVAVADGIYNVALGDTSLANMNVMTAAIFANANTALRVWFSDGVNGFQQLSPDHKLRTVPYAFRAETVTAGSIGTAELADGAVATAKLADQAVTGDKLADATVTQAKVAANAVGTAQLADSAVTAAKLAANIGVWNKSGGELSYAAGNVVVGPDSTQWVKFTGGEMENAINKRFGLALSDSFSYSGRTMGHYTLGWFSDSCCTGTGPVMWQSGYGGIRFFTGGQPRMFLNSGGLLTIGNGPSGSLLRIGDDGCLADDGIADGMAIKNVAGTAYGSLKANIISPSSRQYKKDIAPVTADERAALLKEIDGLEMKLYRYKEEPADAPQHLGIIAEESPARLLSRADAQGVSEHDYASYALFAAKEGLRTARENSARVEQLIRAVETLREENAALKSKLEQLMNHEAAP